MGKGRREGEGWRTRKETQGRHRVAFNTILTANLTLSPSLHTSPCLDLSSTLPPLELQKVHSLAQNELWGTIADLAPVPPTSLPPCLLLAVTGTKFQQFINHPAGKLVFPLPIYPSLSLTSFLHCSAGPK